VPMQVPSGTAFGKERARRYKSAMAACPTARYLEVLPLLCHCALPTLNQWDIIDMGSGTGFVADFFTDIARSVLRVDQSIEQLTESRSRNIVVEDMCSVSTALGRSKADLVVSLASFHHLHVPRTPELTNTFMGKDVRHWTPERYLDVAQSRSLQHDVLCDWSSLLRPGGWLCLIDIPGYPDPAWDLYWDNNKEHTINTDAYHNDSAARLQNWPLEIDFTTLSQMLSKGQFKNFWDTDQHLKIVRSMCGRKSNMSNLIHSYGIPNTALKQSGPMVPADFFDDVVDKLGVHNHFGYFPRESAIYESLHNIGMKDIHVGTVPTPWLFANTQIAAWFVHELLGLGETWDINSIPSEELHSLIQLLDKYLGFYKDEFGRVMLYWQLCYFIARKPSN